MMKAEPEFNGKNEGNTCCCVCTKKKAQTGKDFIAISENFLKIDSKYVQLSEIIFENQDLINYEINPEDKLLMKLCPSCQSTILNFYLLKLKARKAQKGFKLITNRPTLHKIGEPDETILFHTLDIVKNFINKFSVQSIIEDECNHRLIIERQSTFRQENWKVEIPHENLLTEDIQDTNACTAEQELSNNELSDHEIIEALDSIEQAEELSASEEDSLELLSDDAQTLKSPVLENTPETGRFMLNNVEFVDRTPEFILSARKPSEKQNRPKNPDSWIRNKLRNARAKGEEYVTKSGKKIAAKRMQSPCRESCRFKCRTKVTEEDRQRNFNEYWKLSNFILQRKFIFEHHRTGPIKRRRFRSDVANKPRQYSSQYFLDATNSEGVIEQVQVCKSMFLKTFDICPNIVAYLRKKVFTGKVQDLRGFNRRKPSEGHEVAIKQIKANPFYHLEQPMPMVRMFELYEQKCRGLGIEPVKNHTYRKIFAKYNECEFLKPDKVICDVCDRYYNAGDDEKKLLYQNYNQHIQLQEKCKQRARNRERRSTIKNQQNTDDIIVEEHLSFESETDFPS